MGVCVVSVLGEPNRLSEVGDDDKDVDRDDGRDDNGDSVNAKGVMVDDRSRVVNLPPSRGCDSQCLEPVGASLIIKQSTK